MSYNYFGATVDDVLGLWINVDADGLGGTTNIEKALARGARKAASCLPYGAQNVLTNAVEFEVLAQGESTAIEFELGLAPIDGSVKIYRYGSEPIESPIIGETAEETITVSGSTVTLDRNMISGEWLLAYYQVDQAVLDWPDLADMATYYAAYERGAIVYDQSPEGGGNPTVDRYRDMVQQMCEDLKMGQLPSSLQDMVLWGPAMGTGAVFSARVYRA